MLTIVLDGRLYDCKILRVREVLIENSLAQELLIVAPQTGELMYFFY